MDILIKDNTNVSTPFILPEGYSVEDYIEVKDDQKEEIPFVGRKDEKGRVFLDFSSSRVGKFVNVSLKSKNYYYKQDTQTDLQFLNRLIFNYKINKNLFKDIKRLPVPIGHIRIYQTDFTAWLPFQLLQAGASSKLDKDDIALILELILLDLSTLRNAVRDGLNFTITKNVVFFYYLRDFPFNQIRFTLSPDQNVAFQVGNVNCQIFYWENVPPNGVGVSYP